MANFIADKLSFHSWIHSNTSRRTHKGAPTKTTNESKSREGTEIFFIRLKFAAKQKPISQKETLSLQCFLISVMVLKIPSLQECFHMKF